MGDNRALDAPFEVDIGGKTFKFAKLRTKEWGEFHEWAKRRYLRKTLGAVADLLSPQEKIMLLKELQNEELEKVMDEALSDPKGIAYLMFLAARRCDKSLTFEKFMDSLPDDYMEGLVKALEKVNPFSGAEKGVRKEAEKGKEAGKSQSGK